jgi:hypothetical protein
LSRRFADRRVVPGEEHQVAVEGPPQDVLAAKLLDDRVEAGEELPLAGTVFAVKDNIDVAWLPTTAACPSYAYTPERHATAVARLLDAGALCLGKTNLDRWGVGDHIPVVEYKLGRVFAWAVEDLANPTAIWRFRLEPRDGGTELSQWVQMGSRVPGCPSPSTGCRRRDRSSCSCG